MSLPVSPSQVIYSHFKHVSGTPAHEGTNGVNITKLKILDTLIEQLSKMKNQPIAGAGIEDEQDEERINALIEQYQKQIKTAQSSNIYTPLAPITGALFNISV
jgi:F0F1-type ATP synthase epsilon subunit